MTHLLYLAGGAVLTVVGAVLYFFCRHQNLLRERAHLMREAIRNKDFSFRLPTKGLFYGERALQEALNDCSGHIQTLAAQKEIETLQRLTRVLTHEIMNAATPISSITQSYLADPDIKGSPYEEGIAAIHQTSVSMTRFVSNFRKLSVAQEVCLSNVDLSVLFSSLQALHTDLNWRISLSENATIRADETLLRQVFANLIRNAKDAGATTIGVHFESKPKTSHFATSAPFTLSISNNGAPIPPDVARDIFIPFFTTKTDGTGIGLPFARQLLMKQGIQLSLADHAQPGYHVTFSLTNIL